MKDGKFDPSGSHLLDLSHPNHMPSPKYAIGQVSPHLEDIPQWVNLCKSKDLVQ